MEYFLGKFIQLENFLRASRDFLLTCFLYDLIIHLPLPKTRENKNIQHTHNYEGEVCVPRVAWRRSVLSVFQNFLFKPPRDYGTMEV